uniref:Uncharacterized protein n=1 Tax=Helminthocladia australis TaxID=260093 RepID=A0A1G4NTF5_9FLOR|nr:Hypothetical protein ORF_8 [Helminthocladia australis]SCW21938.1 Hypothetical protein ORF_8 [Helminthocladia australis]
METINIERAFEDFDGRLEDEKLIGWSATCLDQTISYYTDYNYNELHQESDSNDNIDCSNNK